MSSWIHDVRPVSLVDWGLHHNTIVLQSVNPEPDGTQPEIRPSCLLKTGDEIGEE